MVNRAVPVALPAPAEEGGHTPSAKPGGPAQRPAVGPVVPLTAPQVSSDELLGGGRGRPSPSMLASRALTRGEPVAGPERTRRRFQLPRTGVNIDPNCAGGAQASWSARGGGRHPAAADVGAQAGAPADAPQRRAPERASRSGPLPGYFPPTATTSAAAGICWCRPCRGPPGP
jgi:hypothetical protein